MGKEIKAEPRRRGWRRFGIIAGLIALYILGEYTIPRFPFGPYKLYSHLSDEQKDAVIPYARLTDENSYPFVGIQPSLEIGISPKLHPKRDHAKAISRFPTVRDCLIKSEQKKDMPDLRLIDWDKIRTMADADVCTWRIFSSLGTPERAKNWLVFHGAQNARIQKVKLAKTSEKNQRHKDSDFYFLVSGHWPMSYLIEEKGKLKKVRQPLIFPTRGWHFLRRERLRRGNGVYSTWSLNGQIKNIMWKWQVVL